jgi:gamma-glutamylcyclotransferase (GGCT)/AIG2-like uncharacterized protein YtfP
LRDADSERHGFGSAACDGNDLTLLCRTDWEAAYLYYFAYGSNMNWHQMQRRCPSSNFVCVARLPDYQFGITRHSRLRDCGTANVVPSAGKEVWGAVYHVTDAELVIMDSFEDGYRREILSVFPVNDGDQPINALVYVAEFEKNVPLPNAEYKRVIIEGARHWQLPETYLSMLAAIQAGI